MWVHCERRGLDILSQRVPFIQSANPMLSISFSAQSVTGTCPVGFRTGNIGIGSCYAVIRQSVPLAVAHMLCRTEYPGSKLVVINDLATEVFLKNLVIETFGGNLTFYCYRATLKISQRQTPQSIKLDVHGIFLSNVICSFPNANRAESFTKRLSSDVHIKCSLMFSSFGQNNINTFSLLLPGGATSDTVESFWTRGMWSSNDEVWVWYDEGTQTKKMITSYTNWAEDEHLDTGVNRCLSFNVTYGNSTAIWHSEDCHSYRKFICEISKECL